MAFENEIQMLDNNVLLSINTTKYKLFHRKYKNCVVGPKTLLGCFKNYKWRSK